MCSVMDNTSSANRIWCINRLHKAKLDIELHRIHTYVPPYVYEDKETVTVTLHLGLCLGAVKHVQTKILTDVESWAHLIFHWLNIQDFQMKERHTFLLISIQIDEESVYGSISNFIKAVGRNCEGQIYEIHSSLHVPSGDVQTETGVRLSSLGVIFH